MKSINPATGEAIREYPQMETREVRKAVSAAHRAHLKWRKVPFAERAELMKAAARVLRANAGQFARVMAEEMGKPITAGRGEAEKCARCLLGGTIPEGPGAYYPPTVLAGVAKGMVAYHDELFGPVASIIPVKNEREAIKVANDSVFGLGAAVFTEDIPRGVRIATKELQAGTCVVNDFVKSDPRLPFGGLKESGYGRELSHYGIKEFVNVKTVCVG